MIVMWRMDGRGNYNNLPSYLLGFTSLLRQIFKISVALGNHHSTFSMNSTGLGTVYKWNHRVICLLCDWLFSFVT